MTDRSAEVLLCGASIIKDVWEIRLRDCRQRLRLEEDRIHRSSLKKINQDWQERMSHKIKPPKRLERKAKASEEETLQTHKMNLSRPIQSNRLQKQVDMIKTAKTNKLSFLRHLNETCPGLMVWAKSWKFSQPFPKPEEGKETYCVSDWGKSWKFLNLQPNAEGKPWFDVGFNIDNRISSDGILFLWEKFGKALDSQHIHQDISASEWGNSWVFTQNRKASLEGTTNGPKSNNSCLNCNKFNNLLKLHNQNQENSEWHQSWKSTKTLKDGETRSDLIPPISTEEDQKNEEEQPEIPWNTSWMYFKKQLHMKSTSSDVGWSQSWRVSKGVAEQEKKSVLSEEPKHFNIFNVMMNLYTKMMLRNSQLDGRDTHSPEWTKSWVTIKNLSEYKEEINKAEPTEKNMKNPLEEPSKVAVKIETPQTEHVKFYVLALPKRQRWHEILNFLGENERKTRVLNWKDSWKMLKHQCKEDRILRNDRCSPLQLTLQTSLTEWTDSRKFINLTLNQDSTLWQQGWSTNIQAIANRRVRELVLNEDLPYNGPTGVRRWSESWRSTRLQYHLERQAAAATNQPLNLQAYRRSVADWEQSWHSSTNQNLHDRPSLTEWKDSWRFSSANVGDLQSENTWFEKSMEILARKELHKVSHKYSRSFDSQTFRKRFPSEEWKDSYRVKRSSDGSGSHYLIIKEVLDWDNSWMFTSTDFYHKQGDYYVNLNLSSNAQAKNHELPKAVQIESRSEWGRSWKLSNPQPPKNIAVWFKAKPKSFCAQDLILWTRHKHINTIPSALHKEPGRIWRKSWKFLKMESKKYFNSLTDESVLMNNTAKIRRHMNFNIDQYKSQEKRWRDACKIAKTQPRPKRDIRNRSEKEQCEDDKGMFVEWVESWRFSNGLKRHKPAEMLIPLSDWRNSWKFLLDPHVPLNSPQSSRGR